MKKSLLTVLCTGFLADFLPQKTLQKAKIYVTFPCSLGIRMNHDLLQILYSSKIRISCNQRAFSHELFGVTSDLTGQDHPHKAWAAPKIHISLQSV